MDQLLQILSGNARLEPKQIAVMTGETEEARRGPHCPV